MFQRNTLVFSGGVDLEYWLKMDLKKEYVHDTISWKE